MLKSSSSREKSHSNVYVTATPSHSAPSPPSQVFNIPNRQPFTVDLGKRGKIEFTFSSADRDRPQASTSQGTVHSSRREERERVHSSSSSRSPKSNVATVGSSTTYKHPPNPASSAKSDHRERERRSSSTPKHSTHEFPSKSPKFSSSTFLAAPTSNHDRHRSASSSRVDGSRPIAISSSRPTNSPEKHAHFDLPHSAPSKMTLHEHVASASPSTHLKPSKHQHSHSQDGYFREPPKGWYNRRGDQFIQKGLVKRQPHYLEWHRVFNKYPEPGTGWMNEEGQFLAYHGGILKNSS